MPPNIPLLARAQARARVALAPLSSTLSSPSTTARRGLSTTPTLRKWEGRKAEENTVREKDSHNVQHDAVKEGKEERAKGMESGNRAASEGDEGSGERAKEEFPEAPDTIGMQDERGGKS